jgi:hypothetical protein
MFAVLVASDPMTPSIDGLPKLKGSVVICEKYDAKGREVESKIMKSSGDATTDAWVLESSKGARRGGGSFRAGWYVAGFVFNHSAPLPSVLPDCRGLE